MKFKSISKLAPSPRVIKVQLPALGYGHSKADLQTETLTFLCDNPIFYFVLLYCFQFFLKRIAMIGENE